ncbi:MAG: hypothetical protein EOP50_01070 [Sphingobacteriales bacterium]|nr:MAG: hypothetical protein EOP50_01070 [Sphingobacteriales bacterium]
MKTLVLFGAGASHGSGDVFPHPPPLGNGDNGLFARLELLGGIAASIPLEMRNLLRRNFEAGMAEYYKYSRGSTSELQREIAGYLAQFTPRITNEYCGILRILGNYNVTYSSLNYDLLFELACTLEGLTPCYSITSDERNVGLLKIHGSSNFWPAIPIGFMKGITISDCNVDVQAPIICLNQNETLVRCKIDKGAAPAMALYAEGKAVKVSPDFVSRQQDDWEQCVREASDIYIIGVRVHTVDSHIWEPLAKTEGRVTYFGLSGDHFDFQTWANASQKQNAFFVEANFEGAVDWLSKKF